jgi:hypothetical protein
MKEQLPRQLVLVFTVQEIMQDADLWISVDE